MTDREENDLIKYRLMLLEKDVEAIRSEVKCLNQLALRIAVGVLVGVLGWAATLIQVVT